MLLISRYLGLKRPKEIALQVLTEILYENLLSYIRAACSAHVFLLGLRIRRMSSDFKNIQALHFAFFSIPVPYVPILSPYFCSQTHFSVLTTSLSPL
jgi:hypothetical protein